PDARLPRRRRAVPHAHRGAAHRLPRRGAIARRTHHATLATGPRPARDDAAHARFAGGEGRAVEESARRSGARAGATRPAAVERRSGGRAIDQSGIGPTQRAAAPADGEPRRPRPRARARSTVMQAMYLMVAAVVGMQQPVVPRAVAPALAQAQAPSQGGDAAGRRCVARPDSERARPAGRRGGWTLDRRARATAPTASATPATPATPAAAAGWRPQLSRRRR